MYPELFTIPGLDYTVTTFGVMMALAFLVGFWVTTQRMHEQGMDVEVASTLLIWIMLGGVFGSKLYFAVDNWIRGAGDFNSLLFARGGITWYGGLIGGFLFGAIGCVRNKVSVKLVADSAAYAVAIGQSLGRVGCFLVGDDYGKATDLPWGVAFPVGLPPTPTMPDGTPVTVHPTQIYEILWLLPVAAVLFARRHRSPFLFGEYLACNGLGRIVIETWRINPRVALGLTEPQWIGVCLVIVGVGGWLYFYFRGPEGDPRGTPARA